MQIAGRAVDDDGVARIDRCRWRWRFRRPRECRARARRSRHANAGRPPPAPGRAAACGRSRAAPPAPSSARPGWRCPAGVARRRVVVAGELAHQPIGEVVEIVQPFAQIGIGLAQQFARGCRTARARPPLPRSGRCHRLAQLVQPAAVIGEHAVGFEHVAVLAAVGDVAALEHSVEIGAQAWPSRRRAA